MCVCIPWKANPGDKVAVAGGKLGGKNQSRWSRDVLTDERPLHDGPDSFETLAQDHPRFDVVRSVRPREASSPLSEKTPAVEGLAEGKSRSRRARCSTVTYMARTNHSEGVMPVCHSHRRRMDVDGGRWTVTVVSGSYPFPVEGIRMYRTPYRPYVLHTR